jgi:hypothetical protein
MQASGRCYSSGTSLPGEKFTHYYTISLDNNPENYA